MVGRALEISFTLIVTYLILANADHFATVIKSAGGVGIGAVKTFQGR